MVKLSSLELEVRAGIEGASSEAVRESLRLIIQHRLEAESLALEDMSTPEAIACQGRIEEWMCLLNRFDTKYLSLVEV